MCVKCRSLCSDLIVLTHWGRVTHICVGNLTIIVSDNGLSPGRRQAIIWTSAGILLIGHLRTNFSEILTEILAFSLKNAFESIVCEMATILSRPQCDNMVGGEQPPWRGTFDYSGDQGVRWVDTNEIIAYVFDQDAILMQHRKHMLPFWHGKAFRTNDPLCEGH